MKKIVKWPIFLLIFLLLAGCGKEIENRLNWQVADFEHTNQNEESVSLEDLKGKVWVADFIFTNCTSVCPLETFNMENLQRKVKKEGLEDIAFVSFTMDPERDTPNVLKEYAAKYKADLSNWHFLTGYDFNYIEQFAKDSFKTPIVKDPNSDQFTHMTYFYLIDKNGVIVKTYHGDKDVPYEEIISDMKILLKEK